MRAEPPIESPGLAGPLFEQPPAEPSFEDLIRTHRDDLHRCALWLCRDPVGAEDLVQETLLRAWRSRGSLKQASAGRAWMFTILRREHARRCGRRTPELAEMDALPAPEGASPAEQAALRQALDGLDARYREPLLLQVIWGMSCQEIAGLLGLSTGAVYTRVFRARSQLRGLLAAALLLAAGAAGWLALGSAPGDELGREAIAHVRAEWNHDHGVGAHAPTDRAAIDRALSGLGAAASGPTGPTIDAVVYAGRCGLGDGEAAHLTVQTAGGPVAVLWVPGEPARAGELADGALRAVVAPAVGGSLAVVGEATAPLEQVAAEAADWLQPI